MNQKFAAFDSSGNITAFYDSVDSPVPAGMTNVVEITQEEWQTCISQQGQWYVSNGALAQVPPPSVEAQLASAQAAQCAAIDAAYYKAIQADVTFKSAGGFTATFQADSVSQAYVMQTTQGYSIAGATPSGFYWVAADNTHVPFTLADLQGLYQAMLEQGWTAFQKRQTLKAQINAITTSTANAVAAVQAITWG